MDAAGDVRRFLDEHAGSLGFEDGGQKPGRRGRPRLLSGAQLWMGVLAAAARGAQTQAAVAREVARAGGPALTGAGVSKRLRDGSAALERAFVLVLAALRALLGGFDALGGLAPWAAAVLAVDESVLDRLPRRTGALRGRPAQPAGRLCAVFDLRRQLWARVERKDDPLRNEKTGARELLAGLPARSLVLFDLGYFGFRWFDDLRAMELDFITRMRAGTSFVLIQERWAAGGARDCLVFLGAHRADRAARAVRLVEFQANGGTRRLITSVLEPERLSVRDIAALYSRRWDIELAFKLAKSALGLREPWSADKDVLWVQVFATLIVAQIVQGLRAAVAARAGCPVDDVSQELLAAEAPLFAQAGLDPVAAIAEHGRALGIIRRSRRREVEAPCPSPGEYLPLAPVPLVRTPRYAGKIR